MIIGCTNYETGSAPLLGLLTNPVPADAEAGILEDDGAGAVVLLPTGNVQVASVKPGTQLTTTG